MIKIFIWSDAIREPGNGIKRINIVDDRNVYVGYACAPGDIFRYVFLRNSPVASVDYTRLPLMMPLDQSVYAFDTRYHRRYRAPAGDSYCEVFKLITTAGGVRYLLMSGCTHRVCMWGFKV